MEIAVCDDEKIIRGQVVKYLKQYGNNFNIIEYSGGYDLLTSGKIFDIIFLDIDMPEIDGMAVADKLRKNKIDSHIIFLTSHAERIYDAFKVKAFRFLTKPIDLKAFNEAVKEAENEILNAEKIVINQKGRLFNIKLMDIVYLEAFGDGSYIYDRYNNVYESRVQLKEWDMKLKDKHFFKIHKSNIVSMFYVKKINNNELELDYSAASFTISRRNISAFKEAYLQFIKKYSRVL